MKITKNEVRTVTYTLELVPEEVQFLLRTLKKAETYNSGGMPLRYQNEATLAEAMHNSLSDSY